ncbi:MAG: hypothetical protein QM654_04740, partial [Dysgonamonadaceae bacterium]
PNPLFCGRIQFAPTHQRRRYPQPSFIIHHSKQLLAITIIGVHIRIYISNSTYSAICILSLLYAPNIKNIACPL